MGAESYKISAGELKKNSEELKLSPSSGDRKADAIEVLSASIYEVGAALSERLENIERNLTKVSTAIFTRR